ncbi:ROK family transcriptional regulator [Homoserinibacter sp. GY 40078]|uniref:ROK family transcriptional regulator n=1 Tax=Homoserinibacter sp. GY 40078 TaxID=2603275 RepID=UPI0011C75144|nr:ROK family transcriptional regulator [Homoserinibacter sp. GY 40078]TXK17000.1 ROK family transcriptional regulator [Homoserinibacter sp. GY 40078]
MVDVRPGRAGGPAAESATVSSLRQRNRGQVLAHILQSGRTTRGDLARECGLSFASATNIVGDLVAEGLVHETGSIASRGGRPIAVVEPRPEGAYLIGADVGERGVAVELFDLSMTRIDREFRGGRDEESPETIAHDLDDALAALRERHGELWPSLVGVGLGLPGIVETGPDGEQTLYAQSLGWDAVAVRDLIHADVPVFAENGAKTQAMAELWFGAARGVQHALVVLLGRGVGLGIIADGRLQRGATSSAAEWGHTKIERDGALCRCGGRGCVEAYVGAGAILDAWRNTGASFEGSGWNAIGELLDAADAGDPGAVAIVDDVLRTLGASLGSLVNLANPERIVVGGWVGLRLMERLGERLLDAVRANSLERPGSAVDLIASTFGGDSVALGAAIMPLESLVREPLAR